MESDGAAAGSLATALRDSAGHRSRRVTAVRVEHLSVIFGEHRALDDVDISFAPGECVLVAGPSGSGKSTLACTLNGMIPQSLAARSRAAS